MHLRTRRKRPSGTGYLLASITTALGAAAAGYLVIGRPWQLRWGTGAGESGNSLPGDELIPEPDLTATRAITIAAPPDRVWPWIAQLGQGRGGFYSYDLLENLVGCDIHSADRIVREWQSIAVGDEVKLAPTVGLTVAIVRPERELVVTGCVPMGKTSPPYGFSWAFALRERPDGTTRLLVRERYAYTRWWAPFLVEPVEVVSFVMHRKMLRGIRVRAERAHQSLDEDGRERADADRGSKPHATREWDYDSTVMVRRAPEAVYAILADQQDYGDHSPGSTVPVLEKIPDGPTRVGTRWHEVVRLAPFWTMTIWSTVTAAEPPERLEMEWSGPWMHGNLTYTFEARPGGTGFRQQETFVPEGLLRLVGGLLRRSLFKRVAARQMDIRDLAEGVSAATVR